MSPTENALAIFESLDPAMRDLARARGLEKRAPVEVWRTQLDQIARYDALADDVLRAESAGCLSWFMWAGLAAIAIFASRLVDGTVGGAVIYGVLFAGWGVPTLIIHRKASQVRRLDALNLPDQVRRTLLPIITTLARDMPPEAALTVSLDLSGPLADGKEITPADAPSGETTYRDVWAVVEAELVGGGHLRLELVDVIRRRRRTKRSASGKYKTKTKHKARQTALAELVVPGQTWAAREALPAGVKVRRGKRIRARARVSRTLQSRHMHGSSASPMSPETAFGAVSAVFAAVVPTAPIYESTFRGGQR